MIVVFIAAGSAPSGVTFNGDACTQLDTQVNGSTGAHIWYRVAPDVATGNVVITFSGSTHAAEIARSLARQKAERDSEIELIGKTQELERAEIRRTLAREQEERDRQIALVAKAKELEEVEVQKNLL